MNLIYKDIDKSIYPKLGDEPAEKKVKNVWVFPDIKASFPPVMDGDEVAISAFDYYITSGEALRKTEILISDTRELMEKYSDNEKILTDLSNLLLDVDNFYGILIETKGQSKYLEVTKCEDGLYGGNICARKDPKKRKIQP
jgi:hypothetical protein